MLRTLLASLLRFRGLLAKPDTAVGCTLGMSSRNAMGGSSSGHRSLKKTGNG